MLHEELCLSDAGLGQVALCPLTRVCLQETSLRALLLLAFRGHQRLEATVAGFLVVRGLVREAHGHRSLQVVLAHSSWERASGEQQQQLAASNWQPRLASPATLQDPLPWDQQ